MINRDFLTSILEENLEGVASFIRRYHEHDGSLNIDNLYQVREGSEGLALTRAEDAGKRMPGILIGAEVCNSFVPLYEFSGLCRAIFLSAVATAYDECEHDLGVEIVKVLTHLSEDQLRAGLIRPKLSIVVDLDTDIEPYRYVKHQLWGLSGDSMKKTCEEISGPELRQISPPSGHSEYWISDDEQIAAAVCHTAKTLTEAKIFQYYLFSKRALALLGIKIDNVPLFFNMVPKQEILVEGRDGHLLDILYNLHERKLLEFFGKLLRTRTPWVFSFPCPNCGESSKRIIGARVSPRNVNKYLLYCSSRPKIFRNEHGTKIVRRGCGYRWEENLPSTPKDLFDIINKRTFMVNAAAREIVRVLRSGSGSPICYSAASIGVGKMSDTYYVERELPIGFGDHRELMTSVLAMQRLAIKGKIGSTAEDGTHFVTREVQLLIATRSRNKQLVDPSVRCLDNQEIHVTDTSALKILSFMDPSEAFRRSVDVSEISLDELLCLRGTCWNDMVNDVAILYRTP